MREREREWKGPPPPPPPSLNGRGYRDTVRSRVGQGVGGGDCSSVISAVWLSHSLRYLTVTARSPGHCQQTRDRAAEAADGGHGGGTEEKDHTTDNDLSINTLHRGPKYKLNSPVSVTKDYALRFHFQIRYTTRLCVYPVSLPSFITIVPPPPTPGPSYVTIYIYMHLYIHFYRDRISIGWIKILFFFFLYSFLN